MYGNNEFSLIFMIIYVYLVFVIDFHCFFHLFEYFELVIEHVFFVPTKKINE